MRQSSLAKLFGFALVAAVFIDFPAAAFQVDPAFHQELIGPKQAKGAVIWNHGRSITTEDSESPTPLYLQAMQDAGWDVLRLNRLRAEDTLSDSTHALVDRVAQLRKSGYRHIVLAGQSFGAFLALMAADASDEIDAVVATAPAAFGNFEDFYDSWRLNATRLYPLLEHVKRARVMLFYFHNDDFDPGGRGERSRTILAQRGLGYTVVDQPPFFNGHWASSTGLFLRRYGNCIRDFAEADGLKKELNCEPVWGQSPSADLKLPDDVIQPQPAIPAKPVAAGASEPEYAATSHRHFRDTWYGFYPNGREVLLSVEHGHGGELSALYALGPGIDKRETGNWSRRKGRVIDDEFVFEEKGKSTLRFEPRPDGGLHATWISPDGKNSMEASMRQIDLHRVAPVAAGKSLEGQPQ
jgi:pimeloyl-ACP methyl ester carboxylesterase